MTATAGLVEEKEGTAERDAGLAAEALREASRAQGNAEEAALQVSGGRRRKGWRFGILHGHPGLIGLS